MDVKHIPSANDLLQLEATFPAISPQTLFDYWTQPKLLVRWWPQEAESEQRLNGLYRASWPAMHWHLRGRYLLYEPGALLAFTWKWDAEEQEPGERIVHLTFLPTAEGNGTRLLLNHSRYNPTPADQKVRIDDHLAGWQHFLPKLLQAAGTTDAATTQ